MLGKDQSVTVTSIEAAARQLVCAIRMFVDGGDPVAVHTLAGAAREIFEKTNKANGERIFVDHVREVHSEMQEKDIWLTLNRLRNFFKHPSPEADGPATLTEADNIALLFHASYECEMSMGKSSPAEVSAYVGWYMVVMQQEIRDHDDLLGHDEVDRVTTTLSKAYPGAASSDLGTAKAACKEMIFDGYRGWPEL